MNKYNEVEVKTAQNLLKRGFKWITRRVYGTITAYKIKPYQEKYVSGSVICSDLVPIFESIKFGDEPVSLESIVHPQILDDVEKRYLKGVIRPFRNRIKYICKIEHYNNEWDFIYLGVKNESDMDFPKFKHGTMYKDMEPGRRYTLEEIGL